MNTNVPYRNGWNGRSGVVTRVGTVLIIVITVLSVALEEMARMAFAKEGER